MEAAHTCHRNVMISGKVFRTVSHQCWNGKQRIIDMDGIGIEQQVLSPMPELLSYWMPTEDASTLLRYLNVEIARMVDLYPARFYGLGAVPLQSMGKAICELEFIVKVLGLAGIEIGTNVNGKPIGDPSFDEFFAAAHELGAAIFVHPLRPCGMDRLVGPAMLEQVLGFPCETGLAAASLLTNGTLLKYPGLRIALSHGGGSFSSLAARLNHAWKIFPALQEKMTEAPLSTARKFYVDSLVYNPEILSHQLKFFGIEKTILGTDYPFVIQESDPISRIFEIVSSDHERQLLCRENALRWLGKMDN
jgi:aminocarboxymuconate-semialdehyde decarboxylase